MSQEYLFLGVITRIPNRIIEFHVEQRLYFVTFFYFKKNKIKYWTGNLNHSISTMITIILYTPLNHLQPYQILLAFGEIASNLIVLTSMKDLAWLLLFSVPYTLSTTIHKIITWRPNTTSRVTRIMTKFGIKKGRMWKIPFLQSSSYPALLFAHDIQTLFGKHGLIKDSEITKSHSTLWIWTCEYFPSHAPDNIILITTSPPKGIKHPLYNWFLIKLIISFCFSFALTSTSNQRVWPFPSFPLSAHWTLSSLSLHCMFAVNPGPPPWATCIVMISLTHFNSQFWPLSLSISK